MKYSGKLAKITLTALATVALGLPVASIAAGPGALDTTAVSVNYQDLDIRSRDGAVELYSRLKRASRKACDYRSSQRVMSVREIAEARECYNNSLDAAVTSIASDALTRVHSG